MPLVSPGNILNNILKGKLGVASIWDTDPTNLERATDGDIDTVTGTGSKVMDAVGNYGVLTFDLGSIKTVLLGARVALWSTNAGTYIYAASSDDNITYRENHLAIMYKSTVAELVMETNPVILTGRYIRIRFSVNAIATAYAKIYEVMGWELTI